MKFEWNLVILGHIFDLISAVYRGAAACRAAADFSQFWLHCFISYKEPVQWINVWVITIAVGQHDKL